MSTVSRKQSSGARRPEVEDVKTPWCIFCGTQLRTIECPVDTLHPIADRKDLRICTQCGWWRINSTSTRIQSYGPDAGTFLDELCGNVSILRKLDLSDINLPLQEVRSYLLAKYESRFSLHPRLFENTVASVFKDIGYAVRVTSFTGDGGVDAVLDNSQGETIGVQVKRYRNCIEAEQIRAFTGALYLKGYTRGVFVTTSRFRRGAKRTAALSSSRGIPIELMDADRFLDALEVTRVSPAASYIDFYLQYGDPSLYWLCGKTLQRGQLDLDSLIIWRGVDAFDR